jgi:hypothetical protein
MIDEKWAKEICSGTTGHRGVEIRDANDVYVLVRVKHPGCYDRGMGRTTSGTTEWFVCENNSKLDGHGYPKKLFAIEGRLTKEHKDHIKKSYNLESGSGIMWKWFGGGFMKGTNLK